jgi:hypothetical protein
VARWIGHDPTDLRASLGARRTDVRVTWAQVRLCAGAGAAVRYEVDTSDRGGPGRRAKRWAQWYIDAVWAAEHGPTAAIRRRAGERLAELRREADDVAEAATAGVSVADLHSRRARDAEEHRRQDEYAARWPWAVELTAAVTGDPELRWCVLIRPSHYAGAMRPALTERLHDVGGSMTFVEGANGCALPRTLAELRTWLARHDEIYHAQEVPRG